MMFYNPKQDAKWQLLRRFMGEFVGSVFLQLGISTVSVVGFGGGSDPSMVQVALVNGFVVLSIVASLGHVSGAHLNPAVTVGFLGTRSISLVAVVVYIVAQLLGNIVGAAFVKAATPEAIQGALGSNMMSDLLALEQGVLVEALATAFLMLVILGVTDNTRLDNPGPAALPIGLTVAHLVMIFGRYSGASMNPARSFGPALVTWTWENHWIYWVGPMMGSTTMTFLYQKLLSNSLSLPEEVKAVDLSCIRTDP